MKLTLKYEREFDVNQTKLEKGKEKLFDKILFLSFKR